VAKGKIKLVVILAGLILAGGLYPLVSRVKATQEQKTEDGGQKAEDSFPAFQTGGREYFYKMLLSLVLVAALGIAVIYVSKKLMPRLTNQTGKQIRVIETAYLAPRKGIHLVQAGNRRLLIASTNETITMLADITEAADFAAELEARS
jgi:flagellar biosynthetic protein FliO